MSSSSPAKYQFIITESGALIPSNSFNASYKNYNELVFK